MTEPLFPGCGAFLEYIDDTGLPSDIYDSYKILGTGNIVANAFLKSMWSKEMTMNDFAGEGSMLFYNKIDSHSTMSLSYVILISSYEDSINGQTGSNNAV